MCPSRPKLRKNAHHRGAPLNAYLDHWRLNDCNPMLEYNDAIDQKWWAPTLGHFGTYTAKVVQAFVGPRTIVADVSVHRCLSMVSDHCFETPPSWKSFSTTTNSPSSRHHNCLFIFLCKQHLPATLGGEASVPVVVIRCRPSAGGEIETLQG